MRLQMVYPIHITAATAEISSYQQQNRNEMDMVPFKSKRVHFGKMKRWLQTCVPARNLTGTLLPDLFTEPGAGKKMTASPVSFSV